MSRQAAALEQALAAGGDAKLWLRLGAVRLSDGDARSAAAAFERATAAFPDALPAWQGLARARFAAADLAGARSVAGSLAARFPDCAFTHLFGGHLHKASGDAAAAEAAYREAVRIEPGSGEALYALADLGCDDAALYQTATSIAADVSADPVQRINAGFAAARMDDQRADYAAAAAHFQRANDLAREDMAERGIRYRPAEFEARVSAAVNCYPRECFRWSLPPLPIELTPVFVVGLPRSGTTLIERIISAHPSAQAGGELPAGPACEHWFRVQRESEGRSGPVTGKDLPLLTRARGRSVDALFERDLDAEVVVDKLPGNALIAGFLRLLFPDAPILHSVRDPRATLWSLYCANFASHEPYYHDLGHLAHYYTEHQRLMEHWRAVLPHPPRAVRYESLVRNAEDGVATVLAAAGLEDHPACHRFHEQAGAVFTASHAQVRRPLYTHAIDHWRHYLPWLGPLADLHD